MTYSCAAFMKIGNIIQICLPIFWGYIMYLSIEQVMGIGSFVSYFLCWLMTIIFTGLLLTEFDHSSFSGYVG